MTSERRISHGCICSREGPARRHENGAGALAPAPFLNGQPSKRLAFLLSVFWY